jgi:hypothetical protein
MPDSVVGCRSSDVARLHADRQIFITSLGDPTVPLLSHANCRVIRNSPWSPLLARRHADGRRIALERVRFAIATCSARRLIENQNARIRGF